jgi:uncharacterized membrane protein YfcA
MSFVLVSICLIVGVLIGAIGIGGVLLVPALTLVADIGVHQAVPVCTLSFLATGIIGVIVYARHGSIQWPKVIWLCLGAVPGAFLGSISLLSIPAAAVMFLGNWLSGNLDFELVLVIATTLVIGAFSGALLVHRIPTEPVRKLIAVLLVFFGSAIGIQQLLNL